MSRIAGLVLAAGESSRMGRDKALLEYRGVTFLEIILAQLRQAELSPIAVVLGHHAAEIQQQTQLSGVEVVTNPEYLLGQTSSLQAGLRIIQGSGADGVLLCLVDHPAVGAEVVRALAAKFRQTNAPVVIPVHNGQRGHPIVIGRTLFAELMSLGPGVGANTVIQKYHAAAQWLECEDSAVTLDVDTPEDYRR
ncbi:MAG: nucleotidyltransferase family protein, partial [Terriglobia bacterium]